MNMTISNLPVRPLTKEDLPILAEWSAEAFTSAPTGLQWTAETMLSHLTDDFRGVHSFAINDNEEMIAGILAYPCKYDRGPELFLHTIAVRKDRRQEGLGKAFLNWFIEYAKEQNMNGIRLDAHVKLPSYIWYDKFGFQPSGWEQKILDLR
jgi:GNAT superfamily N-acetyltransferase